MEFGRRKNPKIPYSKSDLKQAAINANKRLKKTNDKLDRDISMKKESLLSIKKDISSCSKELKSILSEKDIAKHATVEARSGAKKEQTKLAKLESNLSTVILSRDEAQSNLDSLNRESELLNSKISEMNDDLAKESAIKEEITLLSQDKKNDQKELVQITRELNEIKKELSALQTELPEKKEAHKELLTKLDVEAEIKQKALNTVDREYEIKMAELNTKISQLENHCKEKKEEADIIDSLVGKRETEYIEMESKYKQAENALIYIRDQSDKAVELEKSKIEAIKQAFKNWKVSALEEIARLKMKNKIENIDKAGLSEILNG